METIGISVKASIVFFSKINLFIPPEWLNKETQCLKLTFSAMSVKNIYFYQDKGQ